MATNYAKLYAQKNDRKKDILKVNSAIKDIPGIYIFYRLDEEDGSYHAYIGQARKTLTRCGDHLQGRKQHIDLSLYKRKLYSKDNPYGWKVNVLEYCTIDKLDEREQYYIDVYSKKGIHLYNVTGGGQFDKKEDINERHETNLKRYRSGVSFGKDKLLDEVRNYFEKYLDFVIKPPTNKIKERKFEEFKQLLDKKEEN